MGSSDAAVTTCLGQALAQANRSDPSGVEMGRARELLSLTSELGDADATASLAGTWKGLDDAQALRLYRRALEQDPGDPYALGNVLEYELQRAGDLSPVDLHRSSVEAATARRQDQVNAAEDLPWSCFDLAKLSFLIGDEDEAFLQACLAVDRSTAPFMIRTSLRSLDHLSNVGAGLLGLASIRRLYELGLVAVFNDADAKAAVRSKITPGAGDLRPPVVVLVGGSAREVDEHVRGFGAVLRGAFEGRSGTVISGGTTTGVSVVAGDLAEASAGAIEAAGYLPAALPTDVRSDEDPHRYAAIRRTGGSDFGVAEPLAYWTDMLAQGIAPSGVRVLGLGGGRLAAAEYRVALAMGASVGILRGSGGEATNLLRQPLWGTSPALTELPVEAESIRGFLD